MDNCKVTQGRLTLFTGTRAECLAFIEKHGLFVAVDNIPLNLLQCYL